MLLSATLVGTAAAEPGQVTAVYARRVPVFFPPTTTVLTVSSIERAFTLGPTALPTASALSWSGRVDVTATDPIALLWSSP